MSESKRPNCPAISVVISLFLLVGGLAFVGVFGMLGVAQSSGSDQVQSEGRHDDWRRVPHPLPPPPDDPQRIKIFNARDAYFDHFSWTGVPLDQPQPPAQGGRSGWTYGVGDEIPFFKNEAIAVATFDSYDCYLTPSRLTIYTDMKFSVEQVLEPGPSGVLPGQVIDILTNGGSIILSDGRTISDVSYDEPGKYSVQPNHRYALFLEYKSNGQFFTEYKSWELVNGVAEPNRLDEVLRAQKGQSNYSGLPESSFLEAVRKAILRHQQQLR